MKLDRFAKFAWGVLGYNLLVVLWGAFVRASGSGAGCGSHWPLCNGLVVPRDAHIETLIELTHRVTSGIALLAVVALLVWAIRAHPAGHRVRLGAWLAMGLMLVEAMLGAGLVLFRMVADNESIARGYWMILHLVNTFLLIGGLTITAWWASGGAPIRLRGRRGLTATLSIALLGLLVVGASGAIAALGDTLFPSASLAEGLRDSFSPDSHPFIRLRKLHPLLAIAAGAYLVIAARAIARLRPADATLRRIASLLTLAYAVQLGAGVINVILLAPLWLQLTHLLLADVVWILAILLAAASLAAPEIAAEPALARRPRRATAS